MRISDWSSDVCSSDLPEASKEPWERDTSEAAEPAAPAASLLQRRRSDLNPDDRTWAKADGRQPGSGQMVATAAHERRVCRSDRKSVGTGKRVPERVDRGGTRLLKKNKYLNHKH